MEHTYHCYDHVSKEYLFSVYRKGPPQVGQLVEYELPHEEPPLDNHELVNAIAQVEGATYDADATTRTTWRVSVTLLASKAANSACSA